MKHPAHKMSFDQLYSGLEQATQEGLVYCQIGTGELEGLRQYCYSDQTVYERGWNDITLLARGIVLDTVGKRIVATPFPKFFNVGEVITSITVEPGKEPIAEARWPDLPFETFTKLDGSLIIIFHHNGKWRCATKGSFRSEQAKWAVEELRNPGLTIGHTYLAEAIYPSNKIVVDYGDTNELIFLSAYTEEGIEYSTDTMKFHLEDVYKHRIVERHLYHSVSELLEKAKTLPASEEGWVLRFSDGTRMKIKGDEYCRIHRLVSNLTPLAIWRAIYEDQDLEEYRKALPEEFLNDFDRIRDILLWRLHDLIDNINGVARLSIGKSDKEMGLSLHQFPAEVRKFIFPWRKNNGHLLGDWRAKRGLFEAIRPDRNVLEGYRASSAIARVHDNN